MNQIYRNFLVIVVLLSVVAPSFSFAATSAPAPFIYSGWIPYWTKTAGVRDAIAHIQSLKEVSPFSYEVQSNGTITDQLKSTQTPWPDLYAQAQAHGTKIIPTITWMDGTSIYNTLSSSTAQKIHISNLMNIVASTSVDGLDIDYENKTSATKPYFSSFIKNLSTLLHAKNKILACTLEARTPLTARYTTPPKTIEYANDYTVLNKYCDEVRVLAYDQQTIDIQLNAFKGTGFNQPYIPVADVDWVRKVINVTSQNISPKKIMLGVATYGHQYEIIKTATGYTYNRIGSLTYNDAITLLNTTHSTLMRNGAGELSFTYQSGTSTRIVWFSDAQAVNDKIKLAKQMKLKGVAIYKIDGLSDPNIWSYIK